VTATRSAETSALFIAKRLSPKWIFAYTTVHNVYNIGATSGSKAITIAVAPVPQALALHP